jgi:S1-C subfamily serine protease
VPWRVNNDCKSLTAGYADAVFGVAVEKKEAAPARPRLGVAFDTAGKELRVTSVGKGSIAETTGIKEGDVLLEAAGSALKDFAELRAAVQRQAPGTWLPLKIRRQNETLELIAKFPPAKS